MRGISIPFVVGQWVRGDSFYGRAAQIDEILRGPRNCVWLLGTRRIGKTSLLKQLELLTATKDSGYFPLFWDLQGADNPEELHLSFHDSLLDAEERLASIEISISEGHQDLFTALKSLRRRLQSRQLTLLLLCDEVEELIALDEKDPALLRKLRRSLQGQEGIRSVLASTIRLWALAKQTSDTSPFLHGFAPPLYIQRLSDDEAESLVLQANLRTESRPAIEAGVARAIRDKADNHPYLIQLLSKRYLELGDLEEAGESVATDRMVSYFFSVDFEMLSSLEKRVLFYIAKRSSATSDSIEESLEFDSAAVGGELQRLDNLGFIRRDHNRKYVLSSFFFKRWLGRLQTESEILPDRVASESAATVAHPSPLGLIDSRYDLKERIGEGASAIVFRAYDRLLDTDIAIKLIKSGISSGEEALSRLRQEILLAREISHPNILRTFDVGSFRDRTYITMQWINGQTLAVEITQRSRLDEKDVVGISLKLASALEAAHGRRVLHRDIKPSNILLDKVSEPYLTDFGLARLIGDPGITTDGVFLGTPYYSSPEQAEVRPLDQRSDLYSLGIVIFEMATGQRPFQGHTREDVLRMHCTMPPPDPRAVEPEVSPRLADIILRCLEKDPDRRYGSAAELGTELSGLMT